MADQPSTPADRIRFWVDYVVRHGGASHLRSHAALRLSAVQYWSVDVAVFLLVAATLLVLVVCLTLRLAVSVCRLTRLKAAFDRRLRADSNHAVH